MKKTVLTAMAYPPPPPPLPASKGSRKGLIAAAVIVVLIVAAVAVAFVLMSGGGSPSTGTSPSPTTAPTSPGGTSGPSASGTPTTSGTPSTSVTPSASATTTATPTSSAQPTPTPGGSEQGVTNFRVGAWANYTTMMYDAGTVTMEQHTKESIDEDTYNGIDCWLLITETDMLSDDQLTTSKSIIYLSKSPIQGIRMEMYMNDILLYAYDLNETSSTDPGTTGEIDPDTVISTETVTVAAGTFTDCMKAQTINTVSGVTNTAYIWAHTSVPVWGLVKMESYSGDELTMTMELTAYGG